MSDTIPRFKKNENKQIVFIRILWNWQDVSVLKKIIYTLNIKMMSGTALCDQLRPITVVIVWGIQTSLFVKHLFPL